MPPGHRIPVPLQLLTRQMQRRRPHFTIIFVDWNRSSRPQGEPALLHPALGPGDSFPAQHITTASGRKP
jgi:hypothetical protein